MPIQVRGRAPDATVPLTKESKSDSTCPGIIKYFHIDKKMGFDKLVLVLIADGGTVLGRELRKLLVVQRVLSEDCPLLKQRKVLYPRRWVSK